MRQGKNMLWKDHAMWIVKTLKKYEISRDKDKALKFLKRICNFIIA